MGVVDWQQEPGRVQASVAEGKLEITWQTGAPRHIALISMPRLLVRFRFQGVGDEQRYAFMKRFDLYMQRGGG
jgi:hypothetical protein